MESAEELFEEVEAYLVLRRCQPEVDSKKYRMKVTETFEISIEGQNTQEITQEIKYQVEVLRVKESGKCCVEFKRLSGDPFELY